MSNNSGFMPYCTELLVMEALIKCPSSNSSPDGVSYSILKMFSRFVIRPLNIVFQQSLAAGVLPSVWKHAIIIPLYTGRGERTSPLSYRSISLCSCQRKLLERVVKSQLTTFLQSNNLLCKTQYGFTAIESTLTNILSCDAIIAKAVSAAHAYDVISFNFKAAFDKAPHRFVIEALAGKVVRGLALCWYASFLSDRTQQVKVNDSLSAIGDVVSGVIQGSTCGPGLFTLLADTLLRKLKLPNWGFADDLKIVSDVTVNSRETTQAEIDVVVLWSDERLMPLSLGKCGVMHCEKNQPCHEYYIRGNQLPLMESFKDLGVLRSGDGSYTAQCKAVSSSASKLFGAIRRLFQIKTPALLWLAFQSNALPTLMYGSQAWSPVLRKDIATVERVQKRLTKSIRGLRSLPYVQRLNELGVLSLQNLRLYADMVFVFTAIHGMVGYPVEEFGICVSNSSTRGGGIRPVQSRASSRAISAMFCFRTPSVWNKLPLHITNSVSLSTFKRKLKKHLLESQCQ